MVGTGTGCGEIISHITGSSSIPSTCCGILGGGAYSPPRHSMWMQPAAFFPVCGRGRRGDDRTNILEAREDIGLVYGSG